MSEKLPSDSQISHYRVVSKIGAGGMGEVYLAQDTKLDRKVALKILPSDFGDDESRMSRFVREAKSVSALNHPNILTIHEIGEDSGQHYLATEFISGNTLRELIQDGPLPLLQSIEIASQIAAALNAAHEAGIIHRDIKPENVMVRADGLVKVLDFGLAKLTGGASDPDSETRIQSETQPGMIIGTVAYMSPQQARGKAVDARTDVWSLGVVIYEMLSGRQPFRGETMTDTLANILHKDPDALKIEPPDLAAIINKMLGKKVEARFATINEVVVELKYLQRRIEFESELDRKSLNKRTEEQTVMIPSSTTSPNPISGAPIHSGSARADEGFWVAVLPFKYRGANTDLEALADGLSEDIVTGLSRFSYLRVIARGSTLRYANQTMDLRTVGTEVGARYVMEGTLRQAGTKLRLAVQLVDAATGTHLWAENYEREFSSENIFELQDDLVPRIVSTVADWYGALPHSMSETVRLKSSDQLSPYEALLRSFGYFENIAAEEHALVRASLERAVEQEPGNADCWAMLAMLVGEEHRFGFNVKPDSLGRSLKAARRAVEIAHANHFAWLALAQALFFRKEFDPFRDAAERAIVLNPMDGSTVEYLGHLIAFSGNWERGCELAERARQLNPNHPSWYWSVPCLDAYRKGDYLGARPFLLKGNPQKNWLMEALLTAVHGQLGESEAAARHLGEVLTMMPNFPLIARSEFSKWYLPDLVDHLLDGLRKAGLTIEDAETGGAEEGAKGRKGDGATGSLPPPRPVSPSPLLPVPDSANHYVSRETRADEGFWVAVLPFKFTGSSSEVGALAEGLSEEIVTGLSRFSYLRVIARSSTSRFTNKNADVRLVAQELGARYVMEGSLRQAGAKVRLAVQLVDASTGAHLWAENYERTLEPESVFELQDDLVPRIVSTVADQYGALVHSMSESLRGRSVGEYSPHEAVLRSFGYRERITEQEHAEVREILEAAIEVAPNHSDCLSALCNQYWHEYAHGYNLRPDPLGRALVAAQRAVAAAPNNHIAHSSLSIVLFFQKDFRAFRPEAERALALNPMDASIVAFIGLMIAYSGDWESGLPVIERAKQLNPNHPGWYYLPSCYDAYRRGDYRGALEIALKVNMPGYFYTHAILAAAYAQLGEQERARAALRELHKLKPDFGPLAGELFRKWFDDEVTEHVLEGLSKAGLTIEDGETGRRGVGATERSLSPTRPFSDSLHRPVRYVSSESRADEGFWVAVLPFKCTSVSSELRALADGLSEDIVTGLSRFSYLRVIARSSTLRLTIDSADVRSLGRELGARYVMEGSLREAGTKLRLAVQLVDASTGAHLWAENYERTFDPKSVFELQDDLVPRIVSTVADAYGILPHSMSQAVRSKNPDDLTPYEALLRSFSYVGRVSPEDHVDAKAALERAVDQAPGDANCWAMLSILLTDEYIHGFNPKPDSLERALQAARRAVDSDPSNHRAHQSLAWAHYFRKEILMSRTAAERAIALNPMDASTTVYMGQTIAFGGEWERGCSLIAGAIQLNPNHPGWYWYASFLDAYRKHDYQEALHIALKINMPGLALGWVALTAAHGQLGERDVAQDAIRELLALRPDFAAVGRAELRKIWDAELVDHLIDGLRKAGLTIADESGTSSLSAARYISSEARADEGFWVAVLPFKFAGASSELSALAEGLSEDIVTGLSRFSYLRVIARSSTSRFTNESADVRLVAQELGARYVLEGSLRQAGAKLRLAVQLVDASTGAHLWAENYERVFDAESLFELQDDLVPRIVATIADIHGVLPRSMSQLVLSREPEQLSPYEAVLRSFNYFHVVTPEELGTARSCLEMAVAKAPTYVDAWAMLSALCAQDYGQGFNLTSDSLANGLSAARRAVEVGPSNHLAYFSLAQALFFQKEFQSFRDAAERAVALNPMDGNSLAFMGELLTYVGDSERGLELAGRAKQLNPHHPGWYWYADFFNAYHRGDYSGALSFARKANLPNHWGMHAAIAASAGQLGESDVAARAVRDLLRLRPEFATIVRKESEKWWNQELIERFLEGLRKAGLEIKDGEKGRQGDGARGRGGDVETSPVHPVTLSPTLPVSPSPHHPVAAAIAVLPFINRSPDPGNDYFSDGLTEEIITDLSQIEALRVISRNSSMSFKGTTRDTPSIAKALGVSHLVSGSVRRAGDDLRVTVELIEVVGDTSLWSEKYSGKVADVFAIQEEIALKIVTALKVRLTADEEEKATARPIQNVVAYDCYLRARQEMYGWTPESMDRATRLVDQALGIVGENSLLLATKGQIHWSKVNMLIDPDERDLDLAADCAQRALAIDENEYLAIFVRGIVAALRGETVSALRDIYRAHQIRPGDPNVLTELCRFANSSGVDVDDYVRELVAMDPLTPVTWCVVECNHWVQGRIADSAPAARRIIELATGSSPAHIFAAAGLAMTGFREEAIELAATVGEQLAGTPHGSWANFLRYAFAGDTEKACEAMTPILEKGAALVDLVSYYMAAGYSLIELNDESLNWIQVGMNRGFINYPFLATYSPLLENVRSDPRFSELMGEVKKRWETLAENLPGPLQLQTLPASEMAVRRGDGATGRNGDEETSAVQPVTPSPSRPVTPSPHPLVPASSSIAVLPFVNISNDIDNEYFCDGLAEELLNALSKIEALRVAARTSAFTFKGKDVDVREIGQKLNVGAVLEGSVRRSGNRLRISAQLVNIADGYQLWSEKYDRQLEDVFDIQDEISLAIVDALKVKLLGEEKAKVTKRYTDNAEAYELYLQGRYHYLKLTAEGIRKSIEFYQKALALEANYAPALAGLGLTYGNGIGFGYLPIAEAQPAMIEAITSALAIDADLADLHYTLAMGKFHNEGEWQGAEQEFKRTLQLNPGYAIAHAQFGMLLAILSRSDEAVAHGRRALEMDPLGLITNMDVGVMFLFLSHYDQVRRQGQKLLELEPNFFGGYALLGLAAWHEEKKYDQAIAMFERATSLGAPMGLQALACLYALNNERDKAQQLLEQLLSKNEQHRPPQWVALVYGAMGELDKTFEWIDRAYQQQRGVLNIIPFIRGVPGISADSRFKGLLKRLNLPN